MVSIIGRTRDKNEEEVNIVDSDTALLLVCRWRPVQQRSGVMEQLF